MSDAPNRLVCGSCSASYPRIEGVPVLLPESLSRQQLSQTRYFDSEFADYGETYAPENWRLSFVRRIFGSPASPTAAVRTSTSASADRALR